MGASPGRGPDPGFRLDGVASANARRRAGRPEDHRPDVESEHEHLALRRWGGDGAVRLLSADPPHRAVLLERLRPECLDTPSDVDACEVVAGLYRRLHVPALPQLRTLSSYLEQWTAGFEALPRSAPIPHRLVEQAIVLGRELADEPA